MSATGWVEPWVTMKYPGSERGSSANDVYYANGKPLKIT